MIEQITVEQLTELMGIGRDLFDRLRTAKSLVDDGKEVACSRALQGAKTRCQDLLTKLVEIRDGTQEAGSTMAEAGVGAASGG